MCLHASDKLLYRQHAMIECCIEKAIISCVRSKCMMNLTRCLELPALRLFAGGQS